MGRLSGAMALKMLYPTTPPPPRGAPAAGADGGLPAASAVELVALAGGLKPTRKWLQRVAAEAGADAPHKRVKAAEAPVPVGPAGAWGRRRSRRSDRSALLVLELRQQKAGLKALNQLLAVQAVGLKRQAHMKLKKEKAKHRALLRLLEWALEKKGRREKAETESALQLARYKRALRTLVGEMAQLKDAHKAANETNHKVLHAAQRNASAFKVSSVTAGQSVGLGSGVA